MSLFIYAIYNFYILFLSSRDKGCGKDIDNKLPLPLQRQSLNRLLTVTRPDAGADQSIVRDHCERQPGVAELLEHAQGAPILAPLAVSRDHCGVGVHITGNALLNHLVPQQLSILQLVSLRKKWSAELCKSMAWGFAKEAGFAVGSMKQVPLMTFSKALRSAPNATGPAGKPRSCIWLKTRTADVAAPAPAHVTSTLCHAASSGSKPCPALQASNQGTGTAPLDRTMAWSTMSAIADFSKIPDTNIEAFIVNLNPQMFSEEDNVHMERLQHCNVGACLFKHLLQKLESPLPEPPPLGGTEEDSKLLVQEANGCSVRGWSLVLHVLKDLLTQRSNVDSAGGQLALER
eukprot:SM000023S07631  [mRNA]  locus=s23:518081:519915:- [translate_table: standard]